MDNKLEVTNLIDPFLKLFKGIDNEFREFLKVELHEYLYDQLDKLYTTNTFLHRGHKVNFLRYYYPVKVKFNKLTSDFEQLEKILDEYKYISIIGLAGSGKTTLLKYIFINCIKKKLKIPILIELRKLNSYNGDLLEFIKEYILKNNIKPSSKILNRELKKGKFLFLLDGYDEIYSSNKEVVNRNIEEFVDMYSKNTFIISARPQSGLEYFPRFNAFNTLPLTQKEIGEFVKLMVDDKEKVSRILESIEDSKTEAFNSYLSNPLLLSMFILSYENHPEIPSRLSSFYRNVFDTLYSRHDGISKSGFPREKLSGLEKYNFEEVLKQFSYLTYFKGASEFTEESLHDILEKIRKNSTVLNYNTHNLISDLIIAISILIKDGLIYTFPHRSMQEYFCSLFISELPPNKKANAYSIYFEVINMHYNDWGLHFWHMLNELDNEGFNEFFAIKILEEFVEQVNIKRTKKEKFIKMVELINIHMYLVDGMCQNFGIPASNFFKLLDFYRGQKSEFIQINNHEWSKRDRKKLNNLCGVPNIKESSITKDLADCLRKNEFYEMFEKNELVDKFFTSFEYTKELIAKLKNDNVEKSKSIDELLNLY
ncbi:MAG: NACHT domain-containing protein [Saprospiraceae bacterium]|nr:NACHT domain-containing protein [Saprospiraceae bacterium]